MAMHEIGRKAWLDVKMPRRDMKAMVGVGDSNPFRDVKITPIRHASFDPRSFYMQEDGVKDCKAFVMIITNNNIDSYFSREMCRNEVAWAKEHRKVIIPVCAVADKPRCNEFIAGMLLYRPEMLHR